MDRSPTNRIATPSKYNLSATDLLRTFGMVKLTDVTDDEYKRQSAIHNFNNVFRSAEEIRKKYDIR